MRIEDGSGESSVVKSAKEIEKKWQKQLQTSLRINSITKELEDNLFIQSVSHAIQTDLTPMDQVSPYSDSKEELVKDKNSEFYRNFNRELTEIM